MSKIGVGFSHLSFSSRVPREVTDKAWMNSENSMRPSCTVAKGRERERGRERENGPETRWASYFALGGVVLSWTPCCSFKMSLLHSSEKRGQTFALSRLLFLPCTWLSPEAEICHLWSLGRWMLPAHSLKVHKHTTTLFSINHFSNDSSSRMGLADNSEWQGRKYFLISFISSQIC